MFACKERLLSLLFYIALLSVLLNGCGTTNVVRDTQYTELPSKAAGANGLPENTHAAPTAGVGMKSKPTDKIKPTDRIKPTDNIKPTDGIRPTDARPTAKGREDNVPGASGNGNSSGGRNKTGMTGIELKGLVICIDAGHQRKANLKKEPIAPGSSELKVKDPGGASGILTKIPEHELNLKVSRLLKDRLEKLGATVVMTRESSDVNLGNVERAEIANRSNAHLCIRIHADGSDNKAVKGVSVLIPGSRYIKDANMLKQCKNAAKSILKSITDATGAKSRGIIERNDLTGFNWSKVPVVLVEMGFLSNAEEDRLLNTAGYQGKIADGIANAIVGLYSKS